MRCSQCGRQLSLDDTTCSGYGRQLNDAAFAAAAGPIQQSTLPFSPQAPELLAWASQQFSEEEILARLREIQRLGGMVLQDFIRELA
jgi:hypothetical protein